MVPLKGCFKGSLKGSILGLPVPKPYRSLKGTLKGSTVVYGVGGGGWRKVLGHRGFGLDLTGLGPSRSFRKGFKGFWS